MNYKLYIKLVLPFLFLLAACTTDQTTETGAAVPISTQWTGLVISQGYIHSLTKTVTKYKKGGTDSLFQDSNLNDAQYNDLFSTIKIGQTFDSLSSGDKIYWTPQNGFIVFDLKKVYPGTVSNIRTANFKVKLYQKSTYTSDLKFVVSIMDTTILAKTVKERIQAVQSAAGESSPYTAEFTVDLKDKFSSSGKVVIGIRAENAGQLFASVQYCKIEFDADIR